MTCDDVEFLYTMNSSRLVMSAVVSCSHILCGPWPLSHRCWPKVCCKLQLAERWASVITWSKERSYAVGILWEQVTKHDTTGSKRRADGYGYSSFFHADGEEIGHRLCDFMEAIPKPAVPAWALGGCVDCGGTVVELADTCTVLQSGKRQTYNDRTTGERQNTSTEEKCGN